MYPRTTGTIGQDGKPLYYLAESDIVQHFTRKLYLRYPNQCYGMKIPTQHMLKLSDGRTRRVYVYNFGNSGTAYVLVKGDRWIIQGELT